MLNKLVLHDHIAWGTSLPPHPPCKKQKQTLKRNTYIKLAYIILLRCLPDHFRKNKIWKRCTTLSDLHGCRWCKDQKNWLIFLLCFTSTRTARQTLGKQRRKEKNNGWTGRRRTLSVRRTHCKMERKMERKIKRWRKWKREKDHHPLLSACKKEKTDQFLMMRGCI